jgi:DNA-binding transcriptional LysR family regulator
MDRLAALEAFVLAVDRGSLSSAARALGKSAASVTRAISGLEERVGTSLLSRTTRSLKVTEAGERYLATARRVLADLAAAEATTSAELSAPRGVLTVTAPLAFGGLHVRSIVDVFVAAYPEARARLLLLDRLVHLVDEGIDVAVRIAHLPDSALVATAVGEVRRVICASPAYLAAHGRPRAPADLASHRCIAFTAMTPGDVWTFGSARKTRASQVRVRPVLSVNVADAAIASAIDGVGVVAALSYQVKDALGSGALVRLLPAFEPAPLPVHLVYPAASAQVAKVRAFVGMAAPRLRVALGGDRRK